MYRLYAYNRSTGESMDRPKFPKFADYPHDSEWTRAYHVYCSEMKVWAAFLENCPPAYMYVRPKLVHATKKGIPVPRTGHSRWHSGKNSGKSGVIGNSRVLPHRYMDEGDKGKGHNRHIKRVERAQWRKEWEQEQREEEQYGYAVEDYDPYEEDYYYGEDDYDLSDYADFCETCNGPCEL